MRIGILGPLTVHDADGGRLEVTAAGPRLLLHRLALDVGAVVGTGTLIEDLWPAAPPADPGGALQTVVARLRKALGANRAVITSHPAGYALDLPRGEVDAARFEQLVATGRAQARAGNPMAAAETLRVALALWRGEALADAPNAEFAIGARARLAELRHGAHLDRITADLAIGTTLVDPVPLIAELDELRVADPLRERPVALLMRALLAADRRADALRAYERIRAHLADELGVDPGQELREAHLAALREDETPATPEQKAAEHKVGNLPARLSSFVGRETETAEIRAQLRAGRLVTLTGFGGVGKTRLAIEAAEGLPMPDGVWLVELAAVTDPSGLVPAVLAAFGRHGSGLLTELTDPRPKPVEPEQRLHSALADKSLLLVLDNCEQVIDAAADLADRLLRTFDGVRILATSREPLGITGEIRCPVSPLALPESPRDVEAAALSASVALFTERAAAASPGFRLDQDTVADVVRVCRELDGIPLAIELAAARLGSLTPHQLADRIDARFGLLGRGTRTANARHRTLRAALDWSWDLLDDAERVLLRRLSVFSGGADLDAITAICGEDDGTVLDLLAGLVDRSLVVLGWTTPVRYRLLATLREYAAERLTEAGEQDRLRAAHARYFTVFAQLAEPRLRAADQLVWLARLDLDQGNLDAALGHACTAPLPECALSLAAASMWRWSIRGQRVEAQHWAAQALRAAGPTPPAGYNREYRLCRLALPNEHVLAESRALLRECGRPAVFAASAMGQWPAIADLADIAGYFADTAQWLRNQADPWLRATGEFSTGMVASEFTPGGMRTAERHLRAALAAFEVIGDRWGLLYVCNQLSVVLETLGDDAAAMAALQRARAAAEELGGADALPVPRIMLIRSAELRTKIGDYAGAAAELDQAQRNAERNNDPVSIARIRHARAERARYQGDIEEAVRLHRSALRLTQELAEALTPADGLSPQFIARAHSSLARVLALHGDQAAARELHGRAIQLLADTVDAPLRAGVLESAAEWCISQGHAEPAAVLIGAAQALRGADQVDLPDLVAARERCLAELGEAGFERALRRGQALSDPETVALPG